MAETTATTPPAETTPPGEGETPPAETTSPATTTTPPAETTPETGKPKGGDDSLKADLAKERDKRQAAEKRLAEIERQAMSDQEKAVADARSEGENTATAKFAEKLVAAEIKAALTGVVDKPVDIIDELNLAKFVKDGEVDVEAVGKLREKYAAITKPGRVTGDADLGNRPGGKPATYTRAQLRDTAFYRAHEADILLAMREGRITD